MSGVNDNARKGINIGAYLTAKGLTKQDLKDMIDKTTDYLNELTNGDDMLALVIVTFLTRLAATEGVEISETNKQ